MFLRKLKDQLANASVYAAAFFSASMLVVIVGFILTNGWSHLSVDFLTNDYNEMVRTVAVDSPQAMEGLEVEETNNGLVVTSITNDSPFRYGIDNSGDIFPIRTGNTIEIVNGTRNTTQMLEELKAGGDLTVRVRVEGGGIFPMIVSTVLLILVTLLFAAPLGILAAIYMVEYAKQGRVVNVIRFATEILAGIPSVVYGLFGMMMFVRGLQLGTSILAGALTMTILLLPIMMRTVEESLKAVPEGYREASYALGSNKIQTIARVVLPSALPGIMVGIILSIGRIVGESAALIFTLGTFARLPMNLGTGNLSIFEAGATLTLRAFMQVREFGNVQMAAAIGIVILAIVFVLNILAKLIMSKLGKVA